MNPFILWLFLCFLLAPIIVLKQSVMLGTFSIELFVYTTALLGLGGFVIFGAALYGGIAFIVKLAAPKVVITNKMVLLIWAIIVIAVLSGIIQIT